jgi:hypothetical protein
MHSNTHTYNYVCMYRWSVDMWALVHTNVYAYIFVCTKALCTTEDVVMDLSTHMYVHGYVHKFNCEQMLRIISVTRICVGRIGRVGSATLT